MNYTKQCFLDMAQYVEANSGPRPYDDPKAVWCVNPLHLLTCIGNGLGGGDYYGEVGIDDIGTWAFDKIYVTYLRPGKWKEVMYSFRE